MDGWDTQSTLFPRHFAILTRSQTSNPSQSYSHSSESQVIFSSQLNIWLREVAEYAVCSAVLSIIGYQHLLIAAKVGLDVLYYYHDIHILEQ